MYELSIKLFVQAHKSDWQQQTQSLLNIYVNFLYFPSVLYFIEQAHTYQAHTYQAHTYQASSLFAIKIFKVASLCRAFVHSQLLCLQHKLFRISISKIERF